jgi:hypothetical protein
VQGDFFATTPAPLGPVAFAVKSIVHLLSESPGLRMSRLRQAFDFLAVPARLQQAAAEQDRAAVEAWLRSWRSPAGPDRFIPTIEQLAGGTLKATSSEDDPPMALVVPPQPPDSYEWREGIRLAIRALPDAPPLSQEERQALIDVRLKSLAMT